MSCGFVMFEHFLAGSSGGRASGPGHERDGVRDARLAAAGQRPVRGRVAPLRAARRPAGRGLHSSTFRLNVSTFYGIGVAVKGC